MSGAVEGVDVHETMRLVEYDMLHRANPGCGDFTGVRSEVATIITALRAALTTPPARSYADGVRDSAKVADDYERDRNTRARDKRQEGQDDSFHAASASAASRIAAAIRLLSQGGKA